MKTLKKILLNILNFISVVVIICAIIMLISVVFSRSGDVPDFLGYSAFRITTGSMEPTLRTNSLIIVRRVSAEEVEPDDIITFYSQDPALGGAVNTHRVLQIDSENGKRVFTTKGDANYIADRYLVYENDLIGVVVFSSYIIGFIIRLASNPLIFLPLIFLPLFIMLIINMTKVVKMMGKAMDEETTADVKSNSQNYDESDEDKN